MLEICNKVGFRQLSFDPIWEVSIAQHTKCLILGWMYKLSKLRDHANKTSELYLGRWWDYLIKFAIPFVLLILLAAAVINNIINPYLEYPWWIIVLGGVVPCLSIFLLSFVLMKIKKRAEVN